MEVSTPDTPEKQLVVDVGMFKRQKLVLRMK